VQEEQYTYQTANHWLRSFVSGRSQYVTICGEFTNPSTCLSGVPQGSGVDVVGSVVKFTDAFKLLGVTLDSSLFLKNSNLYDNCT